MGPQHSYECPNRITGFLKRIQKRQREINLYRARRWREIVSGWIPQKKMSLAMSLAAKLDFDRKQ